ncbi:MAG: GNAT family N-acetyltransferase [Candidatus Hodarchaeales archaeon]
MDKIKWFETNLVLMFEKERWTEITHHFHNFRSLETNKSTQTYDTYLTLHLTRQKFVFLDSIDEQIIELPSPQYPLPKRYRPLSGGLAFGFLKNNNVTCFAAAPHILKQEPFSYAILRGIETQSLDRRRGYAQKTVQVLCNEVFKRFDISDIFCWVEEKNRAARNLYKKIGFYEDGKIHSIYCDLKK